VILIHGYLGFPQNCWFPWLKRELEARGFEVIAPAMPNPSLPDRNAWQGLVKKTVTDPAQTILVGHSLGSAVILHYLQEYEGPQFPHVILTAGFGRDFLHFAKLKHWFETPLDFKRIRKQAKKWTSIHSKNDPLVPFAEGEWLAEKIGSKFILENKGHLTKAEGACQLPSVLKEILETAEV
jgi:hypothetical protein